MQAYRVFNLLNSVKYKTVGDSVDYCIFVSDVEATIYLLFECSNGKRDWQNNFNYPVKPYKKAAKTLYYHGGYCKAWKSCNDLIIRDLINVLMEHINYSVVVAGWSLGGALAVMAAEDFAYRTGFAPVLITFGAPKVCFGEKTRRNIFGCIMTCEQYRHVSDCVPYMPPFVGYTHVYDIKLGDKFKIKNFFNPKVYHCLYGKKELYEDL